MKEIEILRIFNKTNALLTGHFKLSSGLHSEKYLQCALVLQYPEYAALLCEELARKFSDEKPAVVVAPALGGVIVSYGVASALGARSIFTEREDGKMILRRGFCIQPSDRVLVVEDVVTTGGSTREVVNIVKEKDAVLVGVGAIIDRSPENIDLGVKRVSLLKLNIQTFQPQECPLCKKGIPVIKPGSRKI